MYPTADHFLADDEEQLGEGIKNSGAPAVNLALGRVVPRLERRARVRVRAAMPIKIRVGGDEERVGEAVNFSSKGILFEFPQALALGTALELMFRLPRDVPEGNDVWLDCKAKVVRLALGCRSSDFEVAVATEDYRLLPV